LYLIHSKGHAALKGRFLGFAVGLLWGCILHGCFVDVNQSPWPHGRRGHPGSNGKALKSQISIEDIVLTERKVLCSVCQGATEGSVRDLIRAALRDYDWWGPTHQAIFDALMAIPSESLATIRAELPSRLTRIGFPDVDWGWLFSQALLPKSEVDQLIRSLVDGGGHE
jgi:hypothetical protein